MCENIGSGQVENFSRNRAGFPKVSRNPRKSTFPRLSGFLRILKLYRLEYTEETITKYVVDIMFYYKIYFIISNFIILGNPGNLELQDTSRSRPEYRVFDIFRFSRASGENNIQCRISVIMWCGIHNHQMIGPLTFLIVQLVETFIYNFKKHACPLF